MHAEYTVVPTAAEWQQGLLMTRVRRSSKGADIAKTVILGLLTLYCWIPFFLDGCREWQSFFVGLVALLLAAVIWVVPELTTRREAREIAAAGQTIHLTVTDEGLGFGRGESYTLLTYAEIDAQHTPTLLALTFAGGQMAVLPKRCMEETVWEFVCDRLSQR